jgi:hypothetical protein
MIEGGGRKAITGANRVGWNSDLNGKVAFITGAASGIGLNLSPTGDRGEGAERDAVRK